MTNDNQDSPSRETRLESWKEIASYLQREVRTVIRWEKLEGLPVHRHHHLSRSSVYAYPSELDAWRANRKPAPDSARSGLWRPAPAFASAVTIALALMMAGSGPHVGALAGSSSAALTVRRLENPPSDTPGAAPSPDGRYLSFADWRTGNLTIRDLRTGEERPLTTEGTLGMDNAPVSQDAGESVWSADSGQIAYTWSLGARTVELRVIGLDGGKPRVVSRYEDGESLRCTDWSPDGKLILASFSRENGPEQMVLVSATDGTTRVLAEMKRSIFPETMLFSPDGRLVAYDVLPDDSTPERDIRVLSLDNGEATPLVQHPADDFLFGWSADGKWLVFASDRTGALGLWIVGVDGGRAQGSPRLVKAGIGRVLPMGLTREGALYYGVVTATEDVFVADLDPKSWNVIGAPRKAIEHYEGGNYSPAFSPDGRYLAYVSKRGSSPYPTNFGNALCIRSLETGQEREFYREIWRLGLRYVGRLGWSSGSRFITFGGSDGISITGVYRLDLKTGGIARLIQLGPSERFLGGVSSRDGKYSIHALGDRKSNSSRIVARDLRAGGQRELYRFPRLERGITMALSPDGRLLSFMNAGWGAERLLQAMPVLGGEARVIWDFGPTKEGAPGGPHTWTPDGRYIMFSTLPGWALWRVPVEGGKPEKAGLERPWGILDLTIHPEGRQIAFAGRGGPSDLSEVWVMENFLPVSTKVQ